jgi:hypothetical protein
MSKLVLTDSFADAEGSVAPASHYGMPCISPLEMLITVIFKSRNEGTEMDLVHAGIPEVMASDMTMSG